MYVIIEVLSSSYQGPTCTLFKKQVRLEAICYRGTNDLCLTWKTKDDEGVIVQLAENTERMF
jgi:hypothetical protein